MPTQAWSKSIWPSHNGQVQNDLSKMGLFGAKFIVKKKGILVMSDDVCKMLM